MCKAADCSLRALASAHIRATRRDAARSRDLARPTERAAACLLHLAELLAERARDARTSPRRTVRWFVAPRRTRRALAMFELALWLVGRYAGERSNLEAMLHFDYGRGATGLGRPDIAFVQFQRAARLAPGKARYLAHLARASVDADPHHAGLRCDHAASFLCDHHVGAADDPYVVLGEAYSALGNGAAAARIDGRRRLARELHDRRKEAAKTAKNEASARAMQRVYEDHEVQLGALSHDTADPWQVGHLALEQGRSIARRVLQLGAHPSEAEAAVRLLQLAIEQLPDTPNVRHGVRAIHAVMLATCHDERPKALAGAEDAVGEDPVHAFEREALARVLQLFGDYEGARDAWRTALLFEPGDAGLHLGLGRCFADLANDAASAETRHDALVRCAAAADDALKLCSSEEAFRACEARYLAATANLELGRYGAAIQRLRLIEIDPHVAPVAGVLIGDARLRQGRVDLAERSYQRAIAAVPPTEDGWGQEARARLGHDWHKWEVHAYAQLGLAAAILERNGSLDEAAKAADDAGKTLAKEAARIATAAAAKATSSTSSPAPDGNGDATPAPEPADGCAIGDGHAHCGTGVPVEVRRRALEGRWRATLGRIAYERWSGMTSLAEARLELDRCVEHYEGAVALDGACANYVGLGQALTAKAKLAPGTIEASRLHRRAEACRRLASSGATNGASACDTASLRAAIETMSARNGSGVPGRVPEPDGPGSRSSKASAEA